jgi:Flp pilus assembly pilin Flp
MRNIFHRFIVDESGTGIVEAGIVILVIAVVLMGAMTRPAPGHAHQQSFAASAQ